MMRAKEDPVFILRSMSLCNNEIMVVSALKAALRPFTPTLVRFIKVRKSHCVYANPTEVTRQICVMYANVVPHLVEKASACSKTYILPKEDETHADLRAHC